MINIENLNITLKDFHLKNITLSIKENEFFILMGPTGAGKTVLLEVIAGLVPIREGKIKIGQKDITNLAPEKRRISIVYQDYSLFPNMTAYENISYGLYFHKNGKEQKEKKIYELAEKLNITHILNRYPRNLSGGELQRVALARGLVVEPEIILLGEPLSALDPSIREDIRRLLKNLHQSCNTTFLMVTHDFGEALSLADRAAVMHEGEIVQHGPIHDIF